MRRLANRITKRCYHRYNQPGNYRKEEQIPDNWDHPTIKNCFKGKGDTTRCGNYLGLKLLKHTMKVLKCIVDAIIRQQTDIDSMQFGFMPGRSTTDVAAPLMQSLFSDKCRRNIT